MRSKTLWVTAGAIILLAAVMPRAYSQQEQTWRLGQGGQWEQLSQSKQDRYLLAVAEFKQLIAEGDSKSATEKLKSLKADFPEAAGADFDAFAAAEKLLAKRKWIKASKQYDKFMDTYPDSALYESALERQYSIATAFLGGEKTTVLGFIKLPAYDEAATIINKIADRTGNSPIAKRALLTLAANYESRKKYMPAYETWVDISSRWPTGELGRRALLARADNLYATYRGPEYNDAGLNSARVFYAEYLLRYPEDAKERKISEIIGQIDEQFAQKQLTSGLYYYKTGNNQAANLYLQMVIDNWPQTEAASETKTVMQQMAEEGGFKPKPTFSRKLFDSGNEFLDTWFWVAPLMESKQTED